MGNGRLEARITVPTGGWAVSVAITAIGGSPFTVTIPAGNYFPTDLLSTFQTQLDAASGSDGAFTVSASLGENGTGLVTIAHATQTITVTWTSTDLRDVLGFTGTLTPAALTFTGTKHLRGVWLPRTPMNAPRGSNDGYTEVARSESVGPTGVVTAIGGPRRVRLPEVVWAVVLHRYALAAAETVVGESFEQWWLDTHSGLYSYFSVAPQVRLYWSADASTYVTVCLTERRDTDLERGGDGNWIGLWVVRIRGFKVPS